MQNYPAPMRNYPEVVEVLVDESILVCSEKSLAEILPELQKEISSVAGPHSRPQYPRGKFRIIDDKVWRGTRLIC